ncbi:MAG TPA: hypothetical protein DD727_08605 [Clostridiales bacterium]|nr:hypothetical protein [Clostridiales bacterium]
MWDGRLLRVDAREQAMINEEHRPEIGESFPVHAYYSDNQKVRIHSRIHYHSYYELVLVCHGNCDLMVHYELNAMVAGDMAVLPDKSIHSSFCPPGEDTQVLVVQFMPDFVYNGTLDTVDSRYMAAFFNSLRMKRHALFQTGEDLAMLQDLIWKLLREYQEKRMGYTVYLRAYIGMIIAYLIRRLFRNEEELINYLRDYHRIEEAVSFIEKNHREAITLAMAANQANLTYNYFSTIFHKITGHTFTEYLNLIRVREFERIMLGGGNSVSEAATAAGFDNISNFNRVYRNLRKSSPTQVIQGLRVAKS